MQIIDLLIKLSLELKSNSLLSMNSSAVIDIDVLKLVCLCRLQITAEFDKDDLNDDGDIEFLMNSD